MAENGVRSLTEGYCGKLRKNIYGTLQAALAWHVCLSTWMEERGYLPVNSKKTMIMKWEVNNFICHGTFVDVFCHYHNLGKTKGGNCPSVLA